jgi:hypothetical protein
MQSSIWLMGSSCGPSNKAMQLAKQLIAPVFGGRSDVSGA